MVMPLLMALAAAQPADCAGLAGVVAAVKGAVVDQAAAVPPDWQASGGKAVWGGYAPVPVRAGFCRVQGRIEGTIGFEMWLPADWNGRLLGAGVGGDAGVFNYRDMSLRIAQGFAVVTTDSGHKASDPHWMANPKARVDYEHRAVHLATVAAKALVHQYYARPVEKSYYLGCSGGGRQALKEMQTRPGYGGGDYDGVVAGAPGPYMPLQSVRMEYFAVEQARHPEAMLGDADWALYERASFEACDGIDGVKDGVVENPLACRFRPATLLCKPGQADGCLTAPKLAMLERIIAPMPDEQGRPMDRGLLPGVRTRPGPPSPLLNAMWADAVHGDPNWDAQTFRRSADLAAINRVMPNLRADSTDIGAFLNHGGKAILYQGWQDPSTNAGPTIAWYRALARSHPEVDRSVRLFMVPGMYHCRGGPGADAFGGSGDATASGRPDSDILWALIDWVEQGRVPRRLTATRWEKEKPVFTRVLCPFPQRAVYDGQGDTAQAASFACRRDDTLARLLR